MDSFQDRNLLAIQRVRAEVSSVFKDKIKFSVVGNDTIYYTEIDPKIFHGDMKILEDAVRNKKLLWLVLELRKDATAKSKSYLSDVHYLNETDENINPSER